MTYDLIVVGLGAIGSATLHHASKFPNTKILGIDKFSPPHSLGSSHGESRIIRLANSEGNQYTKLALRSLELWKEIDAIGDIYTQTGGAILSPASSVNNSNIGLNIKTESSLLNKTMASAIKNNIKHRVLSNNDIVSHYEKSIHFNQDMVGYYEDEMGYICPELAIRKQLNLSLNNRAEINTNETVISYKKLKNKLIRVITNKGIYDTKQLILSVGPWVKNVIPKGMANKFKIYKQISCWFQISKAALDLYRAENFPIFMVDLLVDRFACFPRVGNQETLKILTLTHEKETTPELVSRNVEEEYIKNIYERYIRPHLPGITPNCIKTEACLYTQTMQGDFIIDYLPEYDKSVIVASACSGHGFKHSIAIGESLSNSVFNKNNEIDVINQFGNNAFIGRNLTC